MADKAPFHIIPDSPDTISCVNIITRMLQGLGFRYHWATKGLRNKDLDYRPTDSAKNCLETLKHIYILVEIINGQRKYLINETQGYCEMTQNSFTETQDYHTSYQSELTTELVNNFASTGQCKLVNFEDSCKHHLPFLKLVKSHLSKQLKTKLTICPIT